MYIKNGIQSRNNFSHGYTFDKNNCQGLAETSVCLFQWKQKPSLEPEHTVIWRAIIISGGGRRRRAGLSGFVARAQPNGSHAHSKGKWSFEKEAGMLWRKKLRKIFLFPIH